MFRRLVWVCLVCCWGGIAGAQSTLSAREDAPRPWSGRLDFAYALSLRSSELSGPSVGVRYGGFSPSYLRLALTAFSNRIPFGGFAEGSYEWFAITGNNAMGQPDALRMRGMRLLGGGAARVIFRSGVSLEGLLGYGYEQLPAVDGTGPVLQDASVRLHGPVVGANLGYEPGRWLFGLRLRVMPVSFQASSSLGDAAAIPVSIAAQAGFAALQLSRMNVYGVFDYELGAAWANGTSFTASRVSQRFGVGVRLQLPDVRKGPALTRRARVFGQVRLEGTQAPASGVVVLIAGKGSVTTDQEGKYEAELAAAGNVLVSVTVGGYQPFEGSVRLEAEGSSELNITLLRPNGPGSLRGRVFAVDPKIPGEKVPLGEAVVTLGSGEEMRTGPDGVFFFPSTGPGPVPVKVKARGYKGAEEVVAIPADHEAFLELALLREGTRTLATLRGRVRTLAGVPVQATLTVREAKVTAKSDREGRFGVKIRGGRYTVRFEAPGYFPQEKVVEVADGDQALFYVDLSPAE